MDWENLRFQHHPTDVFYQCDGDRTREPLWDADRLLAWGDIGLSPAAAVLSYGYGVIEGLKAERSPAGRVLLFRAADHGARFARSAERLLMPAFPVERFVGALEALLRANRRFIPPPGIGTFYLRPMQHGIEARLGLGKLDRFLVTIYGSPVGGYFAGRPGGLGLQVLDTCRAAPGGTGAVKSISNYAGGLFHRDRAQAEGYDDVLYLDARRAELVEETSGSNFFCRLRSGRLVTAGLGDTILAGITRDSAIRIARERLGVSVEERDLPIEEVLDQGVEVFCTGTAWTVQSVGWLTFGDRRRQFPDSELAEAIRRELRGIQSGALEDPFGWTREVRLDD